MANFPKKFNVARRRMHPLALYSILLGLICSTAVVYLIMYDENITEEKPPIEDTLQQEGSNTWNKSNYYVAAVIDYDTLLRNDVASTWKANIQCYVDIIAECGKLMVDIIVFPEGGIHGYIPLHKQTALLTSSRVPSSKSFVIPCNRKDYAESQIQYFSCAAKQNNVYVAVNLIEKVYSGDSFPQHGHLLYFTEVVFDRTGMVVARYRKFNLYTERWGYGVSTTDEPEIVTFDTDFGVRFGILTCFDIFFDQPARELVKRRNVTHFIHSSAMMSRLPFLPAAAVEFGWSYALDVVVLSSSLPNPKYTIGTNVFFGRRLQTRTYIKPFRTSSIIISPVSKNRSLVTPKYPDKFLSLDPYIPGKIRQASFLVEHVLDRMTTKPLPWNRRNDAIFTYTSSTFECNISASWQHSKFVPNYHFVAYSGPNNYSIANINSYAEMCGITLCLRYGSASCYQPPVFDDASKSIFTSINISTRSTSWHPVRIPTAFDANLVPLDAADFHFRSSSEEYFGKMTNRVEMKLDRRSVNLMTFAVYKFATKPNPISNYNVFDNMMNLDAIS